MRGYPPPGWPSCRPRVPARAPISGVNAAGERLSSIAAALAAVTMQAPRQGASCRPFFAIGQVVQRVLSMTLATERGQGEPARSRSGNVPIAARAERLSGYKP